MNYHIILQEHKHQILTKIVEKNLIQYVVYDFCFHSSVEYETCYGV